MIDDTVIAADLNTETYGPELLFEMSKIARFKITRAQSQDWARNLLFIVYNHHGNDNEATPGSLSTDSGASELALKLSQARLESMDEIASEEAAPPARESEPQLRGKERHECDQCRHLPLFPHQARHFRLVHTPCSHFLAVSYCWPKDSEGNPVSTAQTYQYRREDGSEPHFQPPDHVVDRAIAYARVLGLRQLWIDQVCLPQDESLEQQLGIQGIDLVYQRAHGAIGLFESIITEQRQLDAFRAVLYWRRTGSLIQDDRTATLLIEFLNLLSNDQWNSRAWILQEAFAAGNKMMINVRTAPGVRFQDEWGLLRVPQHLLDTFMFVLDDIYPLLDVCREFLGFMARVAESAGTLWLRDRLQQQSLNAIEGLQTIRPAPAAGGNMKGWSIDGGRQFGTRESCNAAVALSYLRGRKSFPPVDRLAILANLCDYEIRLDTRQMYQFPSLATASFALALMNGDLSLLNPDLYATFIQRASTHTYLWCPPFRSILWNINSREVQPGVFICPRLSDMYHLIDEGFKCPAILWNIDEKVDLSAVKAKWEEKWQSQLVTSLTIIRFPLETLDEYHSRREIVNKYIDEHPEQLNVNITDPFLKENIRIQRTFNIDHLDRESALNMLGDIYADILKALHENGRTALANSIWHSMRRAELDRKDPSRQEENDGDVERERELPDDVADLITSPLFRNPRKMIQLDWSSQGSFFQIWLIERVMRDGFLWAGRGAALKGQEKETSQRTALEWGLTTTSIATSKVAQDHAKAEPAEVKTILQRAQARQLMLAMLRTGAGNQADALQASGSLFEMGQASGLDYAWDDEVRQQMAAFDVDGPATVATPLDRDLERLPHPRDRSMRVSWVVQHAPKPGIALDARIGPVSQPDEEGHSGSVAAAADLVDDRARPSSKLQLSACEPWVFNRDRYRVQTKVRGCWPLIENLPRGAYLFV